MNIKFFSVVTRHSFRMQRLQTALRATVHHLAFPPLFLLLLSLLMFGDVLLFGGDAVLSKQGTDTFNQYLYWREFGFQQLRQGHLALWNPYVFSGMPLVGNFQSALFYPVNWVHLFLPVNKGINAEITINVFLSGLWMYYWTRHRRLHPVACLTAACVWMFGAPSFLKVYPGHLTPIAAISWIPLLLLSTDLLLQGQFHKGCLLGVFAAAMQLLAGHPQTVYTTVIAIAVYMLLQLPHATQRGRVVVAVLLMGCAASALSAAQLGAGWDVFLESTRSGGGVPREFVRTVALPPENYLTLLMPHFFRDNSWLGYWGREYLWELCLFMGVGGALLAGYALSDQPRATRSTWIALLLLWLLASSAYTPLFNLFYEYLPGFNKFRGHGRFIVPAAAFFAMLAAIGLDRLLQHFDQSHNARQAGRLRALAVVTAVLSLTTMVFGLWLRTGQRALWQSFLSFIAATHESYTPRARFTESGFVYITSQLAGLSLLVCAATLLCWALLVIWRLRSKWAAYTMAAFAITEVFVFARANRPTFPLSVLRSPEVQQFFNEQSRNTRVLNVNGGNMAMTYHGYDIWGYDPVVLGRYMAFIAWSQKLNPDYVTAADVQFRSYNRLYSMLRCHYVSVDDSSVGRRFGEAPGEPLPHVLLVSKYSLIKDRASIFSAMDRPSFDPRREVILENDPGIPSTAAAGKPSGQKLSGQARVVNSTSDTLTIEAKVPSPAMLLITDSYSKDWKAWGLEGSAQQEYSVLPANYVLRAIPLQAGTHRIQMQYLPSGFSIGKWVSLIAWIIYGVAVARYFSICLKRPQVPALPADNGA